jgi:hypothetical protein
MAPKHARTHAQPNKSTFPPTPRPPRSGFPLPWPYLDQSMTYLLTIGKIVSDRQEEKETASTADSKGPGCRLVPMGQLDGQPKARAASVSASAVIGLWATCQNKPSVSAHKLDKLDC